MIMLIVLCHTTVIIMIIVLCHTTVMIMLIVLCHTTVMVTVIVLCHTTIMITVIVLRHTTVMITLILLCHTTVMITVIVLCHTTTMITVIVLCHTSYDHIKNAVPHSVFSRPVLMKGHVVWDKIPCWLLNYFLRFGKTCCLLLKCQWSFLDCMTLKMQTASSADRLFSNGHSAMSWKTCVTVSVSSCYFRSVCHHIPFDSHSILDRSPRRRFV